MITKMQTLFGISFLLLTSQWSLASISLTIIHNADMHSKFEEFSGGVDNTMVGGFGRILQVLEETRREAWEKDDFVLYLNAGDTLTGSLWYTVYGWQMAAKFMKLLMPTVMTLGVHDFDISLANLSRYIKAIGAPVVCTNADFSKMSKLSLLIRRYYIVKVHHLRVGIVGYITPRIKQIASLKAVRLSSELDALTRVCRELKRKGVHLIIASGYSGYAMDLEIAKQVHDIDIIVGGMSDTLMWKGPAPGPEIPTETYPYVVMRRDRSTVLVLHAGSDTKYLGRLILQLSNKGKIQNYTQSSVYLNKNVKQSQQAINLLEQYRPAVERRRRTVLAKTAVPLKADCARKECNFGNMVTDAFIDYIASKRKTKRNESFWSDCGIALLDGSALKANIPKGKITVGDLQTALPYNHRLLTLTIRGRDLVAYLETALRGEFSHDAGEFLQISGLYIIIDSDIKVGNRILYVMVRCTDCHIPKYVPLMETKNYKLITTSYLLKGNGGPTILSLKSRRKSILTVSDFEVTSNFLSKKRSVRPEVSERYRYTLVKYKNNARRH